MHLRRGGRHCVDGVTGGAMEHARQRPIAKKSPVRARSNLATSKDPESEIERMGAMSMKPTVLMVGADKGGVGKTTVTRTVLDYLAAKNILVRAFDAEYPRGTLKRFHPD